MCFNNFKILLVLFSISQFAACSATKNTFDYDSSADFSQIKTYQWDFQVSEAFSKANPLIDKRIVKAIEDNLSRKGVVKAKSADITVSYNVDFEKTLKTGGLSAGIGMSIVKFNRGHISLSSGSQLKQALEGTLVIDMLNTKSGKLIWRSTTVQPVKASDASPEDSKKRIARLVSQMFENFPPKKTR
ncbi:MAG: DUF4136 domain-containing protein [Gammaproteobacteria bacterium]|nr:DUF4136 domain-containing protein [Gammaproteobacteria bacterium]